MLRLIDFFNNRVTLRARCLTCAFKFIARNLIAIPSLLEFLLPGRQSEVIDENIKRHLLEVSKRQQRLAIFVHYAVDGHIDHHDIDAINQLKKLGFYPVIVSTSGIEDLPSHSWFRANNRGRDLAVFRDVTRYLASIDFTGYLLLLNNSIVWRSDDSLVDFVNRAATNNEQIVGCTESFQLRWHIQSYFFFLRFSPNIHHVFAQVGNFRWKRNLIRFGELKISSNIKKFGFSSSVVFNYTELIKEIGNAYVCRHRLNPTINQVEALKRLGFRGVKRRAL